MQRGLFERHKLTFAFMLTNKINVSAKSLNNELISVFLRGGGSLDINAVRKKPKAGRCRLKPVFAHTGSDVLRLGCMTQSPVCVTL